jgi:acetylornithine deacetylase/succinyl-diaminopimelate desuccinylase-like protein
MSGTSDTTPARARLNIRLGARRDELVRLCARLAGTDSQNPPGDTTAIARVCMEALASIDGIAARVEVWRTPMATFLAVLRGARPGRRLLLNGHLDTGPVPQPDRWTVPPFGGVVRDGCIYGRGVADMKAGAAAMLMAMATLAEFRAELAGELVLTLVGDEGSGGRWGTLAALANVPEAVGDALLSGDVGSPRVARFGEKGFLWIEVTADGKPAGGAHVYLGINAIDRLTAALADLHALGRPPAPVPTAIAAAITAAGPASETLNGAGETAALLGVTVNVGTIEGGSRINAVPARARAKLDIRFPPGVTAAGMEKAVAEVLARHPGLSFQVLDRADPNWTDPRSEIVRLVAENGREVMGATPAMTIRAGFSDCRFYRERGIPCMVYGATAHHGNAPDEYVTVEDLETVYRVHTLTAFDFLSAG